MRLLGASKISELSPRHVSLYCFYIASKSLVTHITQLNTSAITSRLFDGEAGLDSIRALL